MQDPESVPIHLKLTLPLKKHLNTAISASTKLMLCLKQPNCPFVLYVGSKKLVKRKEFEAYISSKLII